MGVGDRTVLAVVGVVEDDRAARHPDLVVDEAGRGGRVRVGELARAATLVQDDLSVAGELEVLADRERVGEAHQHPLEGFEVGIDRSRSECKVATRNTRYRQFHSARRGQGATRAEHGDAGDRRGRELAHPEELTGRAGDPDVVAHAHRHGACRAEHEDALGRGGIGVGVGVLLLDEEPAQLSRALRLVVTHHDRLDRERAYGRRVAGALDLVDGSEHRRRGVVVDDRPLALTIDDRGTDDVGDVDEEVLVGFDVGVAVDRDADRGTGCPGCDALPDEGDAHVVARRKGRAVGRSDVERHATVAGGHRERNREVERRRARVALVGADVVDRQVDRRIHLARVEWRRRGAGCGTSGGEVGAVVVGVDATSAGAEHGERARGGRRRRGPLEEVRSAAVSDQIDDHRQLIGRACCRSAIAAERSRGVGQRNLAGTCGHGDRRCVRHIRRRQRGSDRRIAGLLDQQILTRRQGSGQLGELSGVGAEVPGASGTGVLDRPAGEVDGRRAAIEELDEVVRVGGATVATPAVHLADHNRGRHRLRARHRQCDQHRREHRHDRQRPGHSPAH